VPSPDPRPPAASFGRRCLAVHDWALAASGAAFGIAIAILILLMTADIAIRYFGWGSLPWLIEVVEYVLCGGSFLAAPWVLRQGAHVRVDLVLTALPPRIARRLEQLLDVVGCAVSAALFYYGCIALAQAWRTNAILYKSWWTPEWIILLPVPVACLLLLVEFVLRVLRVEGVVRAPDTLGRASL
jgi:TRAP-type C4-dicarboxylate transport system permease small subunit